MSVSKSAAGGGGAMAGSSTQVAAVRLVRWKLLPPAQLISSWLGLLLGSQWSSNPWVTRMSGPVIPTPESVAELNTLPPPVMRPDMPGVGSKRSFCPLSEPGLSEDGVTVFVSLRLTDCGPVNAARICVVSEYGTTPAKASGPPLAGIACGPLVTAIPPPVVPNAALALSAHVCMVTVPGPGRIDPVKLYDRLCGAGAVVTPVTVAWTARSYDPAPACPPSCRPSELSPVLTKLVDVAWRLMGPTFTKMAPDAGLRSPGPLSLTGTPN